MLVSTVERWGGGKRIAARESRSGPLRADSGCFPGVGSPFLPAGMLPPTPTSQLMKIRVLLITLVCALAVGTRLTAAEPETELGGKMEKMGGAFRALRRQITDASKNADSLAKVATIRQNAEAGLKLEPALKKEKPAAEQQKFVENYRRELKKFIELCGKLEAALKANNNAEAEKLCQAMGDAQKAGHKSYKKEDKKKK